jgi:AmmeMemoRadiSam system protein B
MDVRKLALDIKEALVELKRSAVFIVSTGLTHFGPLFHYVPFSIDVPKRIYELDKELIARILSQDADGWRQVVDETMVRMHGSWAIELLLRILKPCDVHLEQHYTSGDVLGDYKNSVSYAAIVFEEKEEKQAEMRQV